MKFVSIVLTPHGVDSEAGFESCCFTKLAQLITYTRGTGHHYVDAGVIGRIFKQEESADPIVKQQVSAVPTVSRIAEDQDLMVNGITVANSTIVCAVILTLTHEQMQLYELRIPPEVLGCCVIERSKTKTKLFLSGLLSEFSLYFYGVDRELFRFDLVKVAYDVSMVKTTLPENYVSIP